VNDAPEPGRTAEIEPFWLAYQRARAVRVEGFSASALGHTRQLADTLAELVETGVKRAHATLLRDFEKDLEPLPQPGDHLVVLDGAGTPRAIVRTTHVEKRRFNEIDDAFAFEAGEGDLTLRWWLTAHRQDYAERAEAEGFEAHERLELVLEYFEVVWPPAAEPAPPHQHPT
jgi:uncharacterized protein YhfF